MGEELTKSLKFSMRLNLARTFFVSLMTQSFNAFVSRPSSSQITQPKSQETIPLSYDAKPSQITNSYGFKCFPSLVSGTGDFWVFDVRDPVVPQQ